MGFNSEVQNPALQEEARRKLPSPRNELGYSLIVHATAQDQTERGIIDLGYLRFGPTLGIIHTGMHEDMDTDHIRMILNALPFDDKSMQFITDLVEREEEWREFPFKPVPSSWFLVWEAADVLRRLGIQESYSGSDAIHDAALLLLPHINRGLELAERREGLKRGARRLIENVFHAINDPIRKALYEAQRAANEKQERKKLTEVIRLVEEAARFLKIGKPNFFSISQRNSASRKLEEAESVLKTAKGDYLSISTRFVPLIEKLKKASRDIVISKISDKNKMATSLALTPITADETSTGDRTSPLKPVQVEGYTIYTSKDVYPPDSSSTFLFLRGTRPRKNARVWEIGTATGVIGIASADRGAGFVLATDIGSEEVEIARYNVDQSGYADRIEVEQADGLNLPTKFAGQKFDHIYCNPTLPSQYSPGDTVRFDPEMQLIDHILQNASNYLKEGGTLEVNYVEMASFLVKVYEYGWEPVIAEGTDYTRLFHGGVFDLVRFTLVRQKVREKRQIALEEIKLAWTELARIENKGMSAQPFDSNDQAALLKMGNKYKADFSFNAQLLYKAIYTLYSYGSHQFPLFKHTRLNELYPEQHPQEDRASPVKVLLDKGETQVVDKHFVDELQLLEQAKNSLSHQFKEAFRNGVFRGTTTLRISDFDENYLRIIVDFEEGVLEITSEQGIEEKLPLFLHDVPLKGSIQPDTLVPYEDIQVQPKKTQHVPILTYLSSFINETAAISLPLEIKDQFLSQLLDTTETMGVIERTGAKSVETRLIGLKKRGVNLTIVDMDGRYYWRVMQIALTGEKCAEDELEWHNHSASKANEISYIDIKAWPNNNPTLMVVTELEKPQTYQIGLFRPKSDTAVKDACDEYDLTETLSGSQAALTNNAIPDKYFYKRHLTLKVISRTSPMKTPSQSELLARGGLVSINPDADSIDDLLQAIKLTKEERLYVNRVISRYKNGNGAKDTKQNIEILPLLVEQALCSGYWIPALVMIRRIRAIDPEMLPDKNKKSFYEIEHEITKKLQEEKLERAKKIGHLHRLAVESDSMKPKNRQRTLRRAERASKDEISWLEIVMDMCDYRISWEEVGGMKRGKWSKNKWLSFIGALKERHEARCPGLPFSNKIAARQANGVVSKRDLQCLSGNHGLTRDETSLEMVQRPLRKPDDTVKVIKEIKKDMSPDLPFTRPNLIRHSSGELKKHDLDNLKRDAPALYASLGFVGAQQKTIILNKPQPPNGEFPKIKIGKVKAYPTIGRRIREIREQMGLTQPDFGLRVGYPGKSYARGRIEGLEHSDENGKGISNVEINAIEIVAGIASGNLAQGIKRSLKRPDKIKFVYDESSTVTSSSSRQDRTSPTAEQPGKVEIINEDVVRNISPKVIALDWHETIFTGMSFWKEIIAKMAANIFSAGKTPSSDDWAKAADFVRTSTGRQPLANKRRLIEVANAMGLNPTQTAEELADIYTSEIDRRLDIARKTWEKNPPVVTGIKKLLEALKPKVEMHVISGGRTEVHRDCARQIGFTGFFESFHGSDEYNKQEFLEKIMKDKNLLPHQLVMIGDGAYDMESAKRAGCVAIGIAYDEQSRQMLIDAGADIIINNNFLDLNAILEVLNIRTSPMGGDHSRIARAMRYGKEHPKKDLMVRTVSIYETNNKDPFFQYCQGVIYEAKNGSGYIISVAHNEIEVTKRKIYFGDIELEGEEIAYWHDKKRGIDLSIIKVSGVPLEVELEPLSIGYPPIGKKFDADVSYVDFRKIVSYEKPYTTGCIKVSTVPTACLKGELGEGNSNRLYGLSLDVRNTGINQWGICGAPVFCDGKLIGIISLADRDRKRRYCYANTGYVIASFLHYARQHSEEFARSSPLKSDHTSPMEMLLPAPILPNDMTKELGKEVGEFYRPEA